MILEGLRGSLADGTWAVRGESRDASVLSPTEVFRYQELPTA